MPSEGWLEGWTAQAETRLDTVTPAQMAALAAVLDRDDPLPSPGDPLPLFWHWLYFLPVHRQSDLGYDGHARLGGFLPPVPLPRRMYAGGRVEMRFPPRVGDAIERVSRVVDVTEKEGRSGPLVFLRVRHQISTREGIALVEDHDIVYRSADAGPDKARPTSGKPGPDPTSGKRGPDPASGARRPDPAPVVRRPDPIGSGIPPEPAWTREIVPDPVLLFRYSALTFNGHRIHYDRPFALEEGYAGLVVHAPLVATLLADLLRRSLPDAVVATFTFRAIRPLFDGVPFTLCGRPSDDGRSVSLWAIDASGAMALDAGAILVPTSPQSPASVVSSAPCESC